MPYPVVPVTPANQAAPIDGQRVTYSATAKGIVPASSATDIFTIAGAAGYVIRITQIRVTGSATTEAVQDVSLILRSTNDTGSAATTPTGTAHDTSDPSTAQAVLATYTANPTLGTSVGVLRTEKLLLNIPSSTGVGPSDRITWDFGNRPSKCPTLRDANHQLAVNFNTGSPAGGLIDVEIEWTESLN